LLLALAVSLLPVIFALGLAPNAAVAGAGAAGVLGTALVAFKLAALAWGLVSKGSETRLPAPMSGVE
jgi:hypothetical protein